MVHPRITSAIEWTDTRHMWEVITENQSFMRSIFHDLSRGNGHSEINFLDGTKTLKLDGQVEVIFNPLRLDFNNRKALTALMKILVKTSLSEDFYLATSELKSSIVKYLYDIIDAEDFNFEVATEEFLVDALAKAVNVHIVGDRENFVQLITEYMEMMRELVGVKLFIFINLRSIVSDKEIASLKHNLDNHHLDVLLLECTPRNPIDGVNRLTIDQDLCEI